MIPTSGAGRLRQLLAAPGTLTVPGAGNALTARLIEDAGFEVVYLSGAGVANTFLGAPDIGLVTLTDIVAHTAALHGAVGIPIIVDADTGFGNAINTWHAVQSLERAGASAIQLEDQTFPKRCGHFADKTVAPASEMVEKIRAARDARRNPDTVIIARTDSLAIEGVEAACERANLYHDTGADLVFVEGPTSIAEIDHVARAVRGPQILNLVEGGSTPILDKAAIEERGFAIALYANLALLAAIESTRAVLRHLRSADGTALDRPRTATWAERQATVRKSWFDDLGARLADPGQDDEPRVLTTRIATPESNGHLPTS
ncbi:oxaloacetate decarboxylase [Pseudonocardia ailaonensis]|uniref:Oxaloacetate decarboxylase n=1 Tax=Pseudonocardia ailaonensis TaxID=367279 RepID=A0ABN2NAF9_9PSEU